MNISAKFRRIAAHRGPMKAVVAVEHAMLVAAWNMLTHGDFYRDYAEVFVKPRGPG